MAGLGYLATGVLAPAYTALEFAPLLAGVGPGLATAVGGLLGYAAATAMRRRRHKVSKGVKRQRNGRRVPSRRRIVMKRKRFSGKKKRGGRRKRARTGPGPASGFNITQGDVQYAKAVIGRRPKLSLRNVAKLANAGISKNVYRFQNLSLYTAAQGGFSLNRFIVGVPPAVAATQSMPLYLFDLSALPTNGQGIGSTAAGAACMALKLIKNYNGAGVQPGYSFDAVTGNDHAGVATSNYDLESGEAIVYGIQDDILSWVQFKLDCIGPTAIPCKWTLEMVEFTHDQVVTGTSIGCPSYSNTADNQPLVDGINSFWENETFPLCSHPMDTQYAEKAIKYKKVLWATSFVTLPKVSIDNFTSGEEKMVTITKWFNRRQQYNWCQTASVKAPDDLTTGVANPLGFASVLQVGTLGLDYSPKVMPTKRIYLMVKAQNFGVVTTATTCPTFDLVIRKGHHSSSG